MSDFDVAIVGAGIAGASLAAEISAYRSVIRLAVRQRSGMKAMVAPAFNR
jgi:D-arginine dehydrogenase